MQFFNYIYIFIFFGFSLQAQEFNCTVEINTQRLTNQKNPVFEGIKQGIFNLFNSTNWTKESYEKEERINCRINIIFLATTDANANQFEAEVQIQASRPVYGTNYETTTFLYQDNLWRFSYLSGQPLNYSKNFTDNNLVFLVSFYAYLILGYDFDTFSDLGGTKYFQEALTIANNAQQYFGSNGFGWNGNDIRNRYWFTQHLTTGAYEPFRKAAYAYHRHGLDIFEIEPEKALKEMFKIVESIQKIQTITPISVTLDTFINTKKQELYSAFSKAEIKDQQKLIELIQTIFPTQTNFFRKLLK